MRLFAIILYELLLHISILACCQINKVYPCLSGNADSIKVERFDETHFRQMYFRNGELLAYYNFVIEDSSYLPEGNFKEFDKEKVIIEGNYIKGKYKGSLIFYYTNGQIKEMTCFISDSTEFYISYFENGVTREFGLKLKGQKFGWWTDFHSNGQVMTTGQYMQIPVIKENLNEIFSINEGKPVTGSVFPVKNGVWRYYNKFGEFYKEEVYELGHIQP